MPENKTKSPSPAAGELILLILALLFLLPGIYIYAWYGLTYIPVKQTSEFPAHRVVIGSDDRHCTLDIPAGRLTIRRPSRTAVGSSYKMDALVTLDHPLKFDSCVGNLPNWSVYLEAQSTLVASAVQPFASIRQPAFDRDSFSFRWTFTPEEPVPPYQSHLWLRAIVTEREETVENWNLLVRDFPMENAELMGQPTVFWLIGGGFSLLFGILLLILFLQKRGRGTGRKT